MDGPRKYWPWTLETFDDGYIGSRGRFLVYLPDHPRAHKDGMVLRSIAAYEAYHPGVMVHRGMAVHHDDKNILNDSRDNLLILTQESHNRYHNSGESHPRWKGDAAKPHSKYLRALKAKKAAVADGRLTPEIEAEYERAKIDARPSNAESKRKRRTLRRNRLNG